MRKNLVGKQIIWMYQEYKCVCVSEKEGEGRRRREDVCTGDINFLRKR